MSTELELDFGNIDFENDEGRSVDLLPDFLSNSTNVKNIILAFTPEIQQLYDEIQDIYSTINIFEAVGLQLDNIFGEVLDLSRTPGQTDGEYRSSLLAEASKKVRSGEISVVKSIFRSLTSASKVDLIEYQPARFKMEATVSSIPSASELITIRNTLIEAKQGGNGMDLAAYSQTPFELTSTPNQLNDPNGLSGNSTSNGILGVGF